MASLKTFKSIHDEEILLINNYEFMLDKIRLRICNQIIYIIGNEQNDVEQHFG
jgi:hypothetical protein